METVYASAILFVEDLTRAIDFYTAVLARPCVYRDEYHAVLRCGVFALDIHRVPQHQAEKLHAGAGATRREDAAIKLSFPVDSIPRARHAAEKHGGTLDRAPPRWVVEQQKICDGCDPEGNVFQLREND